MGMVEAQKFINTVLSQLLLSHEVAKRALHIKNNIKLWARMANAELSVKATWTLDLGPNPNQGSLHHKVKSYHRTYCE